MRSLVVLAFAMSLAACNPRPPGDGAQPCGSLEPRGPEEVALCNELEQAVIANVALPEGDPPAGGWPGVVVLHGSGGMYRASGEGDELGPCSMVLHDQFRIWRDMLTERGYAVAMPDSFYSRGFCEWSDAAQDMIPRELTDHERLIVRLFDARAAQDWLCEQPGVDCDRLALLGFSNGASVALLAMQDDLTITLDDRLKAHGPNRPVRGAVAYYPGCGLEGELSSSTDADERERFLAPLAPILVQHGELDGLLDTCAELRDPQVDQVDDAAGRGDDWFDLRIYAGAHHGFDVWFTGDPQADLDARTAAQPITLDALADWLED
ncbi:dienelactone hydrolase family protein [Nannocystaceae bacterium ST9]